MKEQDMMDYNLPEEIIIDSAQTDKLMFSRKFKILLGLCIFFTGVLTICVFPAYLFHIVKVGRSNAIGVNQIVMQMLYLITAAVMFAVTMKIAVSRRPFSMLLVRAIRLLGVIYIAASVICPWLPRYQQPNFTVFQLNADVYMDGGILLVGLLFLIFSGILFYGFAYQRQSDETI